MVPGGWELVLILLVVLVVFGAKRLPDSARALGRSMRILKAETKGLRDDDESPSRTTASVVRPVEPGLPGAAPSGADGQPAQPYAQPHAAAPGPAGTGAARAAVRRAAAVRRPGSPRAGPRAVPAGLAGVPPGDPQRRTPARRAHAPRRPPARAARTARQGPAGDHDRHRARLRLLGAAARVHAAAVLPLGRDHGDDRHDGGHDGGHDAGCNLYAFGPLEQFSIRLKVSSIAGVVLSAPLWLYQLGAFITPALHRKERRYAAGFLGAGTVLFGAGCATAYLTLDKGLDFLLNVGGDGVVTLTSLKAYLNFVSLTLLAFGVAFLFPVVLVFLNIAGVLPSSRMRAWRRGMIVGIAVVAAVLTPSTDPYTFCFMAVPLYLLYEVCIVLGRVRERAARRRDRADPLHQVGDDEASYVDQRPTPL